MSARTRHQENGTEICKVNTVLYSICSARRRWVWGRGETRDEKGFMNTINFPLIFSEQCLSRAKRMIAHWWQNINRVKINQWFGELYTCRRLENITHVLKGRDESRRVGSIYISRVDESDIRALRDELLFFSFPLCSVLWSIFFQFCFFSL